MVTSKEADCRSAVLIRKNHAFPTQALSYRFEGYLISATVVAPLSE